MLIFTKLQFLYYISIIVYLLIFISMSILFCHIYIFIRQFFDISLLYPHFSHFSAKVRIFISMYIHIQI